MAIRTEITEIKAWYELEAHQYFVLNDAIGVIFNEARRRMRIWDRKRWIKDGVERLMGWYEIKEIVVEITTDENRIEMVFRRIRLKERSIVATYVISRERGQLPMFTED